MKVLLLPLNIKQTKSMKDMQRLQPELQKLNKKYKNNKEKFDLIYLDPARRDNHNRKVFLLEDLSPNIIEIQEQLSDISPEILIKLSPLIDIQHLISSLQNIYKEIESDLAVKKDFKNGKCRSY